jgi:hypothetical protein
VLSSTITTAPFPETVTTGRAGSHLGRRTLSDRLERSRNSPFHDDGARRRHEFQFSKLWPLNGFQTVGTAIAADDGSTRLWAGILDDEGTIRVLRSPDQGCTCSGQASPLAQKPTRSGSLLDRASAGQSTWILVWSHFDRADQANSGFIRAHTSTDNGQTWTTSGRGINVSQSSVGSQHRRQPVKLHHAGRIESACRFRQSQYGEIRSGRWPPPSLQGISRVMCGSSSARTRRRHNRRSRSNRQ